MAHGPRGAKVVVTAALWSLALAMPVRAQAPAVGSSELPAQWEELTSPDFVRAVERSQGTCLLPLGIVEKHGPHLPLGTDLLDVREVVRRAVKEEYAIVFPPYYFGQIFEARHQPGTLAYSERLMFDLLQETVDEISRNGIKKIVLVSGHGGNNSFLPFFCQTQLSRKRDSAVYLFQPSDDPETEAKVREMRKSPMDMHAGETETATMLVHRKDLVRLGQAGEQSGADQARLTGLKNAYTAIWWYARFPNHYAGDGGPAGPELGEVLISAQARQLVETLRSIKADTTTLELQKRFHEEAAQPLATPQ
jgi:creatinine amidohydrolase